MASGSKRHAGTSLVETSLVLALVGLLVLLGLGRLGSGSQGLTAVEGELRGCLEQALLRAQAQGCGLQVALQGEPLGLALQAQVQALGTNPLGSLESLPLWPSQAHAILEGFQLRPVPAQKRLEPIG